MGVKLTQLVPRKQLNFKDLQNKKIVIDASNMIYQFLASIRQSDGTPLMDSKGNVTSHLMGTFNRLTNLMSQKIQLCVCFDGKPPILKLKTKEDREHKKQLAEKRLTQAKKEHDIEAMGRYSKQTSRLTPQIVNETKELLLAMGIPIVQSPSEADAQASFMCKQGDVDYVASSDYDCLLYGAPKLLTNLTLSQRKRLPSGTYVKTFPELIELKQVLSTLDLKQDQLIIIAILIGTDYNDGIQRVGPKTALKLVKQYKSFDTLFKEIKADFNWKQIFAVFKSMPVMENYQLNWSTPDMEKIKKILVDKHEFSEERIDKAFNKKFKNKNQSGLNKFF